MENSETNRRYFLKKVETGIENISLFRNAANPLAGIRTEAYKQFFRA